MPLESIDEDNWDYYWKDMVQYCLKQGTCWIKIRGGQLIIYLKTEFTEIARSGGKTKQEAQTIPKKGVVWKKDTERKTFYYKLKATKKDRILLETSCYGTGGIKIKVCCPSGKIITHTLNEKNKYKIWHDPKKMGNFGKKGECQLSVIKEKGANGWYCLE